jgi:CRP-like cAMP-binding protein
MLGEIGIFSPEHQRTSTAQCEAETRLFRLSAEQARRLYIENPQFAYHVLRLISGRLIADRQRAPTLH